jgi:hypothetical protein
MPEDAFMASTNMTKNRDRRPTNARRVPAPETRAATSRHSGSAPPLELRRGSHAAIDAALDEALDETFPASDPIAVHAPDTR